MTETIKRDIQRLGNITLSSSLDGPRCIHDNQRIMHSGLGTHRIVTKWQKAIKQPDKL